MTLASILVALVVIGVALYLLSLVPMDARIKQIIYVIAVAAVVIWALKTLLPAALG